MPPATRNTKLIRLQSESKRLAVVYVDGDKDPAILVHLN